MLYIETLEIMKMFTQAINTKPNTGLLPFTKI